MLAIVASPIQFYMFSSAHQKCPSISICVCVFASGYVVYLCACACACVFYVRQVMVQMVKSVFYDNHSKYVYCIRLHYGSVRLGSQFGAVLCCVHIPRIHSQIRSRSSSGGDEWVCSTFDALYARSTLILYCCWCRYYTTHSSPVPVGWWFCVYSANVGFRTMENVCKQQHIHSARTLSLPLTVRANAFKQTINELCVRWVCMLPFAVLFSLCVFIFAFI